MPRNDNAALMEVLYSRGPVAISFDASRPSFRFFSSGIYVDTEVGGSCLLRLLCMLWRVQVLEPVCPLKRLP